MHSDLDLISLKQGHVKTEHGNTFVKIIGEGPALVFLHGGPGYPHDYFESLETLKINHTLVFYDQIGCGRSDRLNDPSKYQISTFVDELETLRIKLNLKDMVLLGNSWGSMLAMDYTLKYPENVKSIIFLSPCLSAPSWAADAEILCKGMGDAWNQKRIIHESNKTTDSTEYKELVKAYTLKHVCRLPKNPVELDRAILGFNFDLYLSMWGPSEFYATGTLKDYDRVSDLSTLKIPVLYACGRFDEATPETVGHYHKQTHGSKFVIFENSSHFVLAEEPEKFRSVLSEFLKHKNL